MDAPPHATEGYIALRTLPDGRVAGVKRHDEGWALECGTVRHPFACALDALHALGTWHERDDGARARRTAEVAR